MNILHITTYLQGGAGKVVTTLAKSQIKEGNKVIVITSKSNIEGYCNYRYYIDELKEYGAEVLEIDSTFKRDLYLNMKVVNKLRVILVESQIDLVHAHASIPALVSIIAKSGINRRIPIIQTMHGWGLNKKEEHEFVDINVMNLIDKVITVSKSDNNLLKSKGVNLEKLECIYNGINNNDNIEEDLEVIKLINSLRKEGYFIAGCIGSVGYRKNQELLLKSVNYINRKVAIVLIGELEDEQYFNKVIDECNQRVLVLGYKKNAASYMKYFDVLVLPSRSEGLPISVIEAFKEKIPVVCSDIEGCLEIVEDNVTGFIFQDNNFESLINNIKKVMSIKSTDMTKLAYEKYLREFTEEEMSKNYKKLYLKMVSEKRNVVDIW